MEDDTWSSDMLPHEIVPMDTDCEYKSGTMMEVHPGEIPELIRVFYCLDNLNNNNNNHYVDFSSSCNRQVCNSGFDYTAAKELLERDPEQVQYVTYEYKKQRDKCPHTLKEVQGFCSCTATYTGINSFLQSPLRFACLETTQELEAMEFLTTIRDIDPTQFLLQDSNGQLPIDGECVLNASIELLEFLLEIYLDYDFVCPNGVGMAEANFNPITCLCGSYWSEDIHQANEEIRSGNRVVSGKNVLEDNLGIENNFWKKIILLTKAFYHKTIEEDYTLDDENENTNDSSTTSMLRITNDYADRRVEFRLLHACAGIDWFPPNLLRLLVAAFPESLLEKDEDGNLPIHVAAGGFFESYRTIHWDTSGDLEANSGYQKTTIDILLEANVELAKIPDAEGRLPLELAIESGVEDDMQQTTTTTINSKRWRPWEDGGIGSLLDAYPQAAKIRSPVTGKLPLEITLGRGSYRDWEDGVQALLKAYPEAARIRNPRTGKYPLQLAIERETHFDKGVYGLLEVSPEAAWACSAVEIPEEQTCCSRKRRCCSNDTRARQTQAWLPLFAHAALENCSASVVYKLLRTNPESCRRCFENATTTNYHTGKRPFEETKNQEASYNDELTTASPVKTKRSRKSSS